MNLLKNNSEKLEKIVSLVTIIYPLTALPQVFKIWYYKDVTGVSFLTWFLFLVLVIPLILYGIMKEEWKLVLMWTLWIIIYIIILIGIILFG